MLFKHYSKKEVKEIMRKLMDEYKQKISFQKLKIDELTEQNRILSARLSELENKQDEIGSAIMTSVEAGKKLEERSEAYVRNQLKGIQLLSSRCRAIAAEMKEKYPEEDDCDEFTDFFNQIDEVLNENKDVTSFDYGEKTDLDLESLCRELGVEDDADDKEFVIFDND